MIMRHWNFSLTWWKICHCIGLEADKQHYKNHCWWMTSYDQRKELSFLWWGWHGVAWRVAWHMSVRTGDLGPGTRCPLHCTARHQVTFPATRVTAVKSFPNIFPTKYITSVRKQRWEARSTLLLYLFIYLFIY